MHSVTSNAVASAIGDKIVAVHFDEVITSGYIGVTVSPYNLNEYRAVGISVNYQSSAVNATCYSYSFQLSSSIKTWVYVRMGTSNPPDNTRLEGYLLLAKV